MGDGRGDPAGRCRRPNPTKAQARRPSLEGRRPQGSRRPEPHRQPTPGWNLRPVTPVAVATGRLGGGEECPAPTTSSRDPTPSRPDRLAAWPRIPFTRRRFTGGDGVERGGFGHRRARLEIRHCATSRSDRGGGARTPMAAGTAGRGTPGTHPAATGREVISGRSGGATRPRSRRPRSAPPRRRSPPATR